MYTVFCNILDEINNLLWGDFTLFLIFSAAVFLSFRSRFFYLLHPVKLLKSTLLKKENASPGITNFQTLTTALAASMGTGNIIGVATAISVGGAGAVFWMIISAFLVMSFAFTENVLAVKYKNGRNSCGPLSYLKSIFCSDKILYIFCAVCICSSLVVGNITQVNSAAESLDNLGISPLMCGVVFIIFAAGSILRSKTSVVRLTERLVPFAAAFYIIGSVIILIIFADKLPAVLAEIISSAFGTEQICGGVSGAVVSKTVSVGIRRGLFSNEAGMGTSAFAHTSSDCNDPKVMGCFAALEVFIDTVFICTLTALVILCTGADKTSLFGADAVMQAFQTGFGKIPVLLPFLDNSAEARLIFSSMGEIFLAVSNCVFAFASIIGWYFYGEKSCLADEYGTKKSILPLYKLFFVIIVFFGAAINAEIIWKLADIFTFLMLIPNLMAILILSREIKPYANVSPISDQPAHKNPPPDTEIL